MKKRAVTGKAEAPPRGRGRPHGASPAKTVGERQEAFREKLKAEGKKTLRLSLLPEVIEQFDSLRGGDASREEVFQGLVSSAVARKTR